eukprot:403344259
MFNNQDKGLQNKLWNQQQINSPNFNKLAESQSQRKQEDKIIQEQEQHALIGGIGEQNLAAAQRLMSGTNQGAAVTGPSQEQQNIREMAAQQHQQQQKSKWANQEEQQQ